MDSDSKNCLVLDVGKTNVKIHVLDDRQRSLATYTKDNQTLNSVPYPHADVDGIWQWMIDVFGYELEAFLEIPAKFRGLQAGVPMAEAFRPSYRWGRMLQKHHLPGCDGI